MKRLLSVLLIAFFAFNVGAKNINNIPVVNKREAISLKAPYATSLVITKVGGKVKVIIDGGASLYPDGGKVDLTYSATGNTIAYDFTHLGVRYKKNAIAIALVTIGGVVIDSQATFDTQIAAVFLKANTGSGTTGYLPKWTGANSQGNSLIYDNGSKIGIGSGAATPLALLEVRENTALTNGAVNVAVYNHRTSGVIAAGFGAAHSWALQDLGAYDNTVLQSIVSWVDPAHATKRGGVVHYLFNNADAAKVAMSHILQSDQLTVFTGIGTNTPASVLQTTSLATAYTSTATGITLTAAHNVVAVTATGQTITLPTAVGITGRIYTIKLTASGTGVVATTVSQTIDASTTYSLSAQWKYVTVQSNGANWNIIGNN